MTTAATSATPKATDTVVTQFEYSAYVLEKNLEGISNEDSLKRPEPGGNCLNWIVGHLVRSRDSILQLLGKDPVIDAARFEIYARGQDGELDTTNSIPLDELLETYRGMQSSLIDGMKSCPDDQLTKPAPFSPAGNPDETIWSLLNAFAFHESYHSGQTGMGRRLIGKPCAIK